jgi:hypothetical protein
VIQGSFWSAGQALEVRAEFANILFLLFVSLNPTPPGGFLLHLSATTAFHPSASFL